MLELPASPAQIAISRLEPTFLDFLGQHPWLVDDLQELAEYSFPTYDHSMATAYIAGSLSDRPEELVPAGAAHDLGKLYIPLAALHSAARLNKWQRGRMNNHPRLGFERVWPHHHRLAQIIVAHHEYQEQPYPRAESRLEDPLLDQDRRDVALADAIHALASPRSYKLGWSDQEVIAHLEPCFEPDRIQVCLDSFHRLNRAA